MKKIPELVTVENLLAERKRLEAERDQRLQADGELMREADRLTAGGKVDDEDVVARLCTIQTRRSLIPVRLQQIEKALFALDADLREKVLAPRLAMECAAMAVLNPRREALLTAIEKAIAPFVADRNERSRLASLIFLASEKGAAILRLTARVNGLGMSVPLTVARDIGLLFDAVNSFEQKFAL
jgi:hypothetical protein